MPAIRLFNRRFNFSSDDLTIPSLIDITLRFPLIVLLLIFHLKSQFFDWSCLTFFSLVYFYPLLIIYCLIMIIASSIFILSLQGTPVNYTYPRRHVPLLIYIRLVLVLMDIVMNMFGLIMFIREFHKCDNLSRGIIIVSIGYSCILSISLLIMLVFLLDLTGMMSAEKKWEMRIKFLFCCGRGYGGQSSNIENIIKTLQYLFDDERFDLVASDFAAGLVLLQQEDLYEERSIDIYESVPLQLIKDGLYYNSYAQSAFGWFSLAYQYRMTFLPRICFAMRFRTIGFCCSCCCGLACCQNEDSYYDPCGGQYRTLQYLLRKQKPIILYANFFGAFGRAPFYIAADKEKKTIIISIRGTLSATDVLTDINAAEDILETELFGRGYCHSGMHSAAKYIRDEICQRLIDIFAKYPDYSLILCGYSLGAGVACILSILLKSSYPHLKCYGIAMPGSVLSENLILSTRDFIYSYVVDVDMIARASLRSLEQLRDRILIALNKCDRNKFRVLTTTLVETLTKRRQVFHSISNVSDRTNLSLNTNSTISQLVSTDQSGERVDLLLPGTIIHLYSTDRVGLFTRKASYRACLSHYNNFNHLIVHPRMWFDHFPASYSTAFADVIENSENSSPI
ncbi:unnamed protein product [Adineta ricciae]|uniref:sn-1-specific diacylglycerol lipase n=1 Tax=Adineta ricciae TaxID=249248 RepID=A0A815KTF0_ADIRI|nr:unnamed protein product [Adineta ricciae]CAF1397460.1 unnamed protein product [Adineta ricciae]